MGKIRHYIPAHIAASANPLDIVLIGAGGTGSQIITGLARMNYGLKKLGHTGINLYVFDGDAVSEANVGRQIFSPSDIGRNKAEVLVTRVNTFFGLKWQAHPQFVEHIPSIKLYAGPDIVITAIDSAEGRVKIHERLKYSNVSYHLDIGNRTRSGQIVLGTVPEKGFDQPDDEAVYKLPTVIDLYPDMGEGEKDRGPSCSVEQALSRQDLFINQWVSTCALELLWKCFRRGFITDHGAFVDLDTMTVRPLPVDPEMWRRMGWKYRKKRKRKKAA